MRSTKIVNDRFSVRAPCSHVLYFVLGVIYFVLFHGGRIPSVRRREGACSVGWSIGFRWAWKCGGAVTCVSELACTKHTTVSLGSPSSRVSKAEMGGIGRGKKMARQRCIALHIDEKIIIFSSQYICRVARIELHIYYL